MSFDVEGLPGRDAGGHLSQLSLDTVWGLPIVGVHELADM